MNSNWGPGGHHFHENFCVPPIFKCAPAEHKHDMATSTCKLCLLVLCGKTWYPKDQHKTSLFDFWDPLHNLLKASKQRAKMENNKTLLKHGANMRNQQVASSSLSAKPSREAPGESSSTRRAGRRSRRPCTLPGQSSRPRKDIFHAAKRWTPDRPASQMIGQHSSVTWSLQMIQVHAQKSNRIQG